MEKSADTHTNKTQDIERADAVIYIDTIYGIVQDDESICCFYRSKKERGKENRRMSSDNREKIRGGD